MRLVGEPPLPFARLPDAEAEVRWPQRLRKKGWTIGTCPLPPPGDERRLVRAGRGASSGEVRFSPRAGDSWSCATPTSR